MLRLWFAHARDAGIQLPALRKVLWLGEAWHPQLDEDMAAVAPQARRWGMFGSTETWVVGTNTPDCAVDMFHPLPEQLVHVGDDDLLDFTTLNPDMLNPVLRYQTGDAGEIAPCPCGTPGAGDAGAGPPRLASSRCAAWVCTSTTSWRGGGRTPGSPGPRS